MTTKITYTGGVAPVGVIFRSTGRNVEFGRGATLDVSAEEAAEVAQHPDFKAAPAAKAPAPTTPTSSQEY